MENDLERMRKKRKVKEQLQADMQLGDYDITTMNSHCTEAIWHFLSGGELGVEFFAINILDYCRDGDPRQSLIRESKLAILKRIDLVLSQKPFTDHIMSTNTKEYKENLEQAKEIISSL